MGTDGRNEPSGARKPENPICTNVSFILFTSGTGVNLSARSMGEINVQIIMEALGGGGPLTMSGAQIKNTSVEKARQMLLEAIDQYFETK